MNLTQDEALAFLNTLKGSLAFAHVRVNFAPIDDVSIGVLGFDSEAILCSCDLDGLVLTWSGGSMRLRFEGASFRFPDPEQTALAGMEIVYEGLKCVICKSIKRAL
jgi:hypothetical protein